jgi:transcriptional regulator with XRE-family HTH domain
MRPSRNPELIAALGIEVKARRTELEMTQEDLAGRMGIDRPFISLIEVGRKQPTISVLYALAAALELRLEEFAARIDDRYGKASKVAERSRRAPKA